jgi:Rieske Fe-S protein
MVDVVEERIVDERNETWGCCTPVHERRTVLQAALGVGLGLPFVGVATAQEGDPRQARPQAGDRFVLSGDKTGKTLTPADLPVGAPPVMAYPMDAKTHMVRDGSRLNQVMLIRLDSGDLAEETRAHAAEGIVAYSAVCTHTGCDVWTWQAETKTLKCPCHDSEFDPKQGARVIAGPAPRRLPMLPVKVVDGVLVVADGFLSRVGFQQGGGG